MSSFDDAMALADPTLFSEMGSTIFINGAPIPAVVSPLSSYQTISDGSGGFQKLEGAKAEILTSAALAAGGGAIKTGHLISISNRNYRVVEIRENGFTTTLILASTSGTAAQF
jgi:hypothetical protein